ncbi:uncharacterized protein ACNLHF_011072 isoform 1-T1 [Anomaloglossus baeobatrachus]
MGCDSSEAPLTAQSLEEFSRLHGCDMAAFDGTSLERDQQSAIAPLTGTIANTRRSPLGTMLLSRYACKVLLSHQMLEFFFCFLKCLPGGRPRSSMYCTRPEFSTWNKRFNKEWSVRRREPAD